MEKRRVSVCKTVALPVLTGMMLIAGAQAHGVERQLLASGLSGAAGSTIGPDSALYVTEPPLGRVVRIDRHTGTVTSLVEGLPTPILPNGVGGAMDVEVIGGKPYVLVTAVGEDLGGTSVGIYRVDGPANFTPIADIGEFSSNNPPPVFELPTGVPYALEKYRGGS